MDFFFKQPKLNQHMFDQETALAILVGSEKALQNISQDEFKEPELEIRLRTLVAELNLPAGAVFKCLRLVLTGKTAAPGLFETMQVLDKERVMSRVASATKLFN